DSSVPPLVARSHASPIHALSSALALAPRQSLHLFEVPIASQISLGVHMKHKNSVKKT
ncbi:hypothetical protein TorRG33x02_298430, partial [Trema orientale]